MVGLKSKKTRRTDQEAQPFLGLIDPISAAPVDPRFDRVAWTDQEMRNMRRNLLFGSLQELRANLGPTKGQTEKRKEIMDWMLSEDREHPYSFIQACSQEGLDHEKLRDQALGILRFNGIRYRIAAESH